MVLGVDIIGVNCCFDLNIILMIIGLMKDVLDKEGFKFYLMV